MAHSSYVASYVALLFAVNINNQTFLVASSDSLHSTINSKLYISCHFKQITTRHFLFTTKLKLSPFTAKVYIQQLQNTCISLRYAESFPYMKMDNLFNAFLKVQSS